VPDHSEQLLSALAADVQLLAISELPLVALNESTNRV